MAPSIPTELLIYLSLIISVAALFSSLRAASSASKAARETKSLALKWELESIKPVEPPPAQGEGEKEEGKVPIVREATEEMIGREGPRKEQGEPSFESAEALRSGLGLEAFVLFNSLGQVIDQAGAEDARYVAALMSELAGLAGLSSGDSRFVFVGGGKREVVARIATMDSKVLYLYARGVADPSEEAIERLISHAKRYLDALTPSR